MMMLSEYWAHPLVYLINTFSGLYFSVLLLRFLLQLSRADYYNPISQWIIKLTHPLLHPLRRIIPSFGRVDTASLVVVFSLQMLVGALLFFLQGQFFSIMALGVWSLSECIERVITLYFFSIVIYSILSWVVPNVYNPAMALLFSLNEPILRHSRHLFPPIGGLDLSPLIPLIALELARMVLLPPLQQLMVWLNRY